MASFAFNKGVGYFSGTATGEGFATDAVNGELLWEAVDKRGGTRRSSQIHSITGATSTTCLRRGAFSFVRGCRSWACVINGQQVRISSHLSSPACLTLAYYSVGPVPRRSVAHFCRNCIARCTSRQAQSHHDR